MNNVRSGTRRRFRFASRLQVASQSNRPGACGESRARATVLCIIPLIAALIARLATTTPALAAAPPGIGRLLTEYLRDPIGLDVRLPRFSWQMSHSERGARQTAYQVQVGRDPARLADPAVEEVGPSLVWDSGRVSSSQSLNVAYAGPALESGTTYYWRARLWDQTGAASPFSPPAHFEMGLLQPDEWTGTWITAPEGLADTPASNAPMLRREFTLDKPIARARAYVAGAGYYELRLNGRKVGDHVLDPAGTTFAKRVLYSTFDVTPLLRTGANTVGAQLGHGWLKSAPRLLLQLNVEYTDGSHASVVTDATWRAAPGPIVENSIYDGETYDARLEQPGWDQPGFDDSAWARAAETSGPGGVISSQMIPPERVVATLPPVAMTNPRPGVYVFDFGQNLSGWCRLEVTGPAGTRVTLQHGELLFPDGLVNSWSLRGAKGTDTYVLRGGAPELYEPRFTYHGFRYVQLEGFPGTPEPASLAARLVYTDLPSRGEFACSNELLNWVHRLSWWSYRTNFHGYPTDCPQRDERQGWMGDAHMTADMGFYNVSPEAAYTQYLQDIQDVQGPDGRIPDVVPHFAEIWGSDPGDPSWASAYLFIAWDMYRHTGDRRLLEQHFDGMVRWVEMLRRRAPENLLTYGNYGDWISRTPASQALISTCTYYRCASVVARVAEILGRDQEAREYHDLADRIAGAFNARFLNPVAGFYDNGSQLSQAYPLFLGIVPPASHQAVVDQLVKTILLEHGGHLDTGFVGTRVLLDALTREGRADVAYTVATRPDYPGWGFMVRNGSTTLWEFWELQEPHPRQDSLNHAAFGFVSGWFYSTLAGIAPDPDHPGWERFTVRPHVVSDLRQADATVETLRGRAASHWSVTDSGVRLQVEVPANSRATISVPKAGLRDVSITEGNTLAWRDGTPAASLAGIDAARDEGEWVSFDVGSGAYDFRLTGRRAE